MSETFSGRIIGWQQKAEELEAELEALKEKVELLESALDMAFEDDRGCLDDLIAQAQKEKENK